MAQQISQSHELSLGKRPFLTYKEAETIGSAIQNETWSHDLTWDIVVCPLMYTGHNDGRQHIVAARLGYLTSLDEPLFLSVSCEVKRRRKILRLELETTEEDTRHFSMPLRQLTESQAAAIATGTFERIKTIKDLVAS